MGSRNRWPVSLYWTLMLGVPAAGLITMAAWYAAVAVVRYYCLYGAR